MRLVRLELFGFKSFADPTVLEFGQRSLTGVVGPNGCGKSNVVDAVRWALGETRPSSMRGSGMTDVIFKGSVSRPPMGFAEVTLVFDNSDGVLSDRSAEVSVTRRIEASGEGSYLIDGQRVRLKDVKDLLFDTGLGSRGYSVLEQGRIDAVLSANPQQRRAVFEEAAGISRYRQRRHEAELRLKHVAADMERVDDVIAELRTRVRSLKIQAGKAERYLVARDEWSSGRKRFLGHRLFNIDGELHALLPGIQTLDESLEELRQRRGAHDSEAQAKETERGQVVAELDRVSGESGRLEGEARALEERRKALLARVENWKHSAQEEGARAEQLAEEIASQTASVEALAKDAVQLSAQAAEAKSKLEELAGRNRICAQKTKEFRQASEAQNELVLARLHDRGAAASRSRQLAEDRPRLEERLSRVSARREELQGVLAGARDRQDEIHSTFQFAEDQAQGALAMREERREAVNDSRGAVRGVEERRSALELERAGHQARVDALRDRERQVEEMEAGNTRLLEANEAGEGPCERDALMGVVADHLTIDTRLARALDGILGSRASALVVRDAHVARRILEWGQTEQQSGLSLVVPPGLGAPPCPAPTDFALFKRFGNGVEGRLSDLVRCEEHVRPLARALLGDVVVVSDLDLGLKLVAQNPQWRYVTPQGEVVDAAGLRGGYSEVDQGAVGRRAAADELENRCGVLSRDLAELDAEGQREEAALAAAQQALTQAEENCETTRAALTSAAGNRAAFEGRLAEQEAALTEQEEEHSRVSAERAQLDGDLRQAEENHRLAEVAFEQENAALAGVDEGRHRLEQERDGIQREMAGADVERQRVDSERQACDERLVGERMRIGRDEAEHDRAQRRSGNFAANAVSSEGEAREVQVQESRQREQAQILVGQLESLRMREREGAALAQKARQAAEAVQVELDQASAQLSQQRLTQQRLELERQDLLVRADEELSLTEDDLKLGFESEPDLATAGAMQALAAMVSELKAVLEKLGPVNLDAVHELEEVGERLEHLEVQAADLIEARKNLAETIRRIDEESRRMFQETFTEVRKHFRVIFRQLFGGGRADLRLEAGQDILDAGIEIIARPPGREMLPIGLLSGGQRTMTALALLFAVFQAKPSPFCILDEVDAALDDANIDRFLAMLHGFRETSQFVVVTHNKGTMSACEALFGVTMQTKGVSRFVAVELNQVDEFAPETTGRARDGTPDLIGRGNLEVADDEQDVAFEEDGDPVVELQPKAPPESTGGGGAPTASTSAAL